MAFLLMGLVLLGAKLAGLEALERVHWAWVLLPFGLAAAWWALSDMTGLTARRVMARLDRRVQQRRRRWVEQMGLDPGPDTRPG